MTLSRLASWKPANTPRRRRRSTRRNWPFGQFRSKIVGRTGGEVNVIKAALELCGRTGEASRVPMRCLTEDERNELGELLHGIGVPGLQATAPA